VNAKYIRRWTVIGCCGLLAILSTGCARWIEVTAQPDSAQEPTSHTIARDEQVPLILDRVRITQNGSPQNPSSDTEERLLGSLEELGLFSRLARTASNEPTAGDKFIRARVLFDEAVDPHPGAAAWKGIVIGASMFILTPFIPLEYDYAAHVTLELERWDGQIKHYESRSAGTARYHLFGATPIMLDELKGHVTESCLTALAQQIIQDTVFYSASSAPIVEPGIRTVSIKSRSSESSVSTPGVIPVSIEAEP
jgi:hypothetical protein